MTSVKVYRPTTYVSWMGYTVLLGFFLALLLEIYALSVTTIDGYRFYAASSISAGEAIINLAKETLIGLFLVALTFIFGITVPNSILISIHVSDASFRVTSPLCHSEWFTWDKIMKVRDFSIIGQTQIAVDGLEWTFKLNGLLLWMYPYGAIVIGRNGFRNGRELLKEFRQKRPDLFYNSR